MYLHRLCAKDKDNWITDEQDKDNWIADEQDKDKWITDEQDIDNCITRTDKDSEGKDLFSHLQMYWGIGHVELASILLYMNQHMSDVLGIWI